MKRWLNELKHRLGLNGRKPSKGRTGARPRLEWLEARLAPAAGVLDPTFGSGGKVLTDLGTSSADTGHSVAVDGSGRTYVAGYSDANGSDDFALARYTAGGVLDTTFGTGGKVLTDLGTSSADFGLSVALDGSGRAYVAGYSTANGSNDFALARYTAGGVLDTTFGTGGKVLTDLGTSSNDFGQSVAVDGSGRAYVAGYSTANGSNDFALARYTAAGALDPTFGTGGKVLTDLGTSSNDFGLSVALDGSGRAYVAGYSTANGSNDFALARYTAGGVLDTTFGTGGKVLTDLGTSSDDGGQSVALDGLGRAYVAGYSHANGSFDFALARYTADGVLDTTFGTGGKVLTDLGTSSDDFGQSVALDGLGRAYVAGYSHANGSFDFALARYTADGVLDATFGTGGKVLTDLGTSSVDVGLSVAVDGSGRAYVAGYSHANGSDDFALARYTADNIPPVVDLDSTAPGNDVTTAFTEQTPVAVAPNATISDADGTTLASLTASLAVTPDGAAESLSLNTAAQVIATNDGLTINYASGVLTVSGSASLSDYQTVLRGVIYNDTSDTPTATDRRVSVVVNDGADDSVARTATITVTPVDDAPTIANTVASQPTNDDTPIAPFAANGGVTIADVDSPSLTVTVKISDTANGTFTAASLAASGFSGVGQPAGQFVFTGSPTAATAAIRQLVFRPTQDQVQPGDTVTTHFLISVSDGVAPAVTDNTTSVVATSVAGVSSLPFADSFDRANSANLGGNWTPKAGSIGISGNRAVVNAKDSVSVLNGVSVADVTVSADVVVSSALNADGYLVARYGADGSYYKAGLIGNGSGLRAFIIRVGPGGATTAILGTPAAAASGTGTLRFDAVGTSLRLYLNGTLVAFANDSAPLGSGSAGVSGTAGTTFDNFSAGDDPRTTPALPFTDAFAATTDKQLSSNWTNLANGNVKVDGVATVNAPSALAVLNGVSVADVTVSADVVVSSALNAYGYLVARYGADGSYYKAGLIGNGSGLKAFIFKVNADGSSTLLGTPAAVSSGTGTLRFDAVGTSLRLYLKGTLVAFANDSAPLGSGSAGISGTAGTTFDNFHADLDPRQPASLPFTDTFTATTDAQLSAFWTNLANGNVKVNGVATVNSPSALAVLNAVSTANVDLQADVVVSSALNAYGYLVARYGADGSYYKAGLIGSGTGLSAYIFKVKADGSSTMLGVPAKVASGSGTLGFVVAGNSLKLYFNNVLVDSAIDSTPLSAGSAGFSGTAGSTFDNFSAQ